jgi:acetyl esterase
MIRSTLALSAVALAIYSHSELAVAAAHVAPAAMATPASGGMSQAVADKDMQAVLDAHAGLNPKAIEKSPPAEARKQPTPADAVNVVLKKQGKSIDPAMLVPGVKSADRMIAGAAGQIPARVYTPDGAGPFPLIVYFHGGGWVIGDKQVYDGGARGLAKQANAVVVSVDYRLAPENKFPAAWDDSFAAYKWVLANAASIKGDPKKVAIAGESAGGNLALTTAIAARDGGVQMPLHVLAVYPVAQTNLTTESYTEHAMAKPLNKAMIEWFVDKLTTSPANLKDPRLSVVGAKLQGLPPVTLINAQIDPLLSDSVELEAALKTAGVAVERKTYNGVTHEFFGMAAVVQKAKDAQEYAGKRLKQAFGS